MHFLAQLFAQLSQPFLVLIVVLPILGAIANGLWLKAEDKKTVSLLAPGVVGLAFLLALSNFIVLLWQKHTGVEHPRLSVHLYEWFSIHLGGQSIPINVTFTMDALSGLMTLVVTGIGTLIHVYSLGYMSEEKSYNRFFAYLNLFTASMLILVLASNIPLMFVGWEGVGLCSYLLIGFWYENETYAKAGRKAFVANRVGDLGVLIGMFTLVMATQSFEFEAINHASTSAFLRPFPVSWMNVSVATVACLFLFLGVTGKSAQVPLYVWLPDAMAGPTPVSALIHAATMVTAGVYLMCRLSFVFLHSEVAMAVVAVTGTVTALLAASIAVVQREMKKILAYSTVSQLGFMVAACGVGAFSAGFFHVFTHAFFKACLFLGAGSVMHAVHAHGDADIFKLGGMKKHLPTTHWTFLASCLAIAGFPLLSGFFSKDEILLGAATQALSEHGSIVGWIVFVGLALAAFMTAFYMFRLYFFTFTGEYRSGEGAEHGDGHGHDDHHAYDPHPHDGGPAINVPLAVLGVGAIAAGWLGLPHHWLPNWWGHWMEASIASPPGHEENMSAVWMAMGVGTLVGLSGIGLAYVLYNGKSEDTFTAKLPKGLFSLVFDKWRIDELYEAVVLGPIRKLAQIVGNVDQTFVDGIFAGLTSRIARLLGALSSRVQTGTLQSYGFAMALGLLGLLWWTTTPHVTLEATVAGENVTLRATPGLGYSYAFDGDSDNERTPERPFRVEAADRPWGADPTFTPQYNTGDYAGFVLGVTTENERLPDLIEVGEGWQPVAFPGLDWRDDEVPEEARGRFDAIADARPRVMVRATREGIEIRPNGAHVSIGGSQVLESEGEGERPPAPVARPGQRVRIGRVSFVVRGIVRATVHVRNAFGARARATVDVILEQPARPLEEHAALVLPESGR